MVILAIFPLHSFTLVIFVILLTLSTSNGVDHRYKECSSSIMSSCGNLRNVGYPFWGDGRPKYCGHPALELQCQEHQGVKYPMLKIGNDEVKYYVNNISTRSSSSETIIQLHELPATCPFHFHRLNEDVYDIFEFSENNVNVNLSYDCPEQHMRDPGVLNCNITCFDNHFSTYYLNNSISGGVLLKGCTKVEVPVLKNELGDLKPFNQTNLSRILFQGFELVYPKSKKCWLCEQSDGVCGSNDPRFVCHRRKSEKWKIIVGTVVPGGFLILIALNVGFWCCMKQKFYKSLLQSSRLHSDTMNSDLEFGSSFHGIAVLPYSVLQEATDNFNESKELGDGGFGVVYYGKLKDGREVAVKRLYEKNYKQIEQFMNEIEILTRLRHPNLVTLYGCTSRNSRELLLVYEFIPNGTVADHLYGERKGSETLSWDIRMKIAIETARALSYLHASEIIHRDVKTNNILLDNNFSVKVADFGLSRLFPCDATHVSTVPQGTPGYLDPQYHRNYQVTNKSDVYSFGVVLVELISSLPAVDISRQEDEINLYDYAMNKIQNGMLSELVDQNLGFELDFKVTRMITLVAELAFRCLQQDKDIRPTMDDVLESLLQIGSTDYETLKEKDMSQSRAASKPSSLTAETDTKQPLAAEIDTQNPHSPNSVIVSWVSGSSESNTRSNTSS